MDKESIQSELDSLKEELRKAESTLQYFDCLIDDHNFNKTPWNGKPIFTEEQENSLNQQLKVGRIKDRIRRLEKMI